MKNRVSARLVNNDPILWTMLNAMQQQQAEIRALRAQLGQPPLVAKIDPRAGEQRGKRQPREPDLEEMRSSVEFAMNLQRLRKKDAGWESRWARPEQALASPPGKLPAN